MIKTNKKQNIITVKKSELIDFIHGNTFENLKCDLLILKDMRSYFSRFKDLKLLKMTYKDKLCFVTYHNYRMWLFYDIYSLLNVWSFSNLDEFALYNAYPDRLPKTIRFINM